MENLQQKAYFLKNEYTNVLQQLDEHTPRQWGKMNVRQMIEHMSDYMRIASGRSILNIVTPEERIPAMQAFLESEKPFRENTPNVLMPDTPPTEKNTTKAAAINELQNEIDHFFAAHQQEAGKLTPNPFFGHLNFDQQVQLLHKHAVHHLRQFGVAV